MFKKLLYLFLLAPVFSLAQTTSLIEWTGLNAMLYNSGTHALTNNNIEPTNWTASAQGALLVTQNNQPDEYWIIKVPVASALSGTFFGVAAAPIGTAADNFTRINYAWLAYGQNYGVYELGNAGQAASSPLGAECEIKITHTSVTFSKDNAYFAQASTPPTFPLYVVAAGINPRSDAAQQAAIVGATITHFQGANWVDTTTINTTVVFNVPPLIIQQGAKPLIIQQGARPLVVFPNAIVVVPTLAITAQPSGESVTVGNNATFSVAVINATSPTFTWKKNGTVISGATASTYTYPNVQNTDNGAVFSVTVMDNGTTLTSNSAALTVIPAALTASTPSSQTVTAGGSTIFTSSFGGGVPSYSYLWTLGTQSVATTSSYTYNPAVYADSGKTVHVAVTDSRGTTTTSGNALLTVHDTAHLVQSPSMNVHFTTDATNTTTSIGIYNSNDSLVRLMGTSMTYSQGVHDTLWDGKDNLRNYVPNGNYYAKIQKNSVHGQWMGTVLNNSDSISGPTKQHGTQSAGMEIIGHKIIFFHSYLEGNYGADTSSIEHPRRKGSVGGFMNGTNFRTCNDGNRTAYCLASTDYNTYYVYGVDTATGYAVFPNQAGTEQGRSLLAVIPSPTSGLAAQHNGQNNFIFISFGDSILVVNRTGQKIITNYVGLGGSQLACDMTNGLWVGTHKYTVNSNGTLNNTGIVVSGILGLQHMSVSPDNSKISFIDGDLSSEQIKTYNNSTGTYISTYGQATGYLHNPVVTNDRFAFTVQIPQVQTQTIPFISYAPDGTVWVNDAFSFREMHFTGNFTYLENIQFLPPTYNTYMDINSPTHIYGGYLRCTVDMNSNDPQHNYIFDRNYSAAMPAGIADFESFHSVGTFSNGRTYATIRLSGDVGNTATKILDITDSVRFTGQGLVWQTLLDKDGTNVMSTFYGAQYQYITGFINNNPTWSNLNPYIGFNVPNKDSIPNQIPTFAIFKDSSMAVFSAGFANGYHIGFIPKGGTKFRALTGFSTGNYYYGEYVKDGSYYNNGNSTNLGSGTSSPGGCLSICNNILYWNHHGEFWNNSGQTSFHNLMDSYGLPIGTFGTLQDANHPVIECAPWNSGNALKSQIAFYNGKYILSYGDESRHGGVHIAYVTIDSTNLKYETCNLTKTSNPPTFIGNNTLNGGLMWGVVPLPMNDASGWARSDAEDNSVIQWNVSSGTRSYNHDLDPDISAVFSYAPTTYTRTVTKSLGTVATSNNWKLSGKVDWSPNIPDGINNNATAAIQVLDDAGKVIANLKEIKTPAISDGTGADIVGNAVSFATYYKNGTFYNGLDSYKDFSVSYNGTNITFFYNGSTYNGTTTFENGANPQRPATFRMYFSGTTFSTRKGISLEQLKFNSTVVAP